MAFNGRFMGFDEDPFFSARPHHPGHASLLERHRQQQDALMRRGAPFGMMMMDPFRRMHSMMTGFDSMFAQAGEMNDGGRGNCYSQRTVMQFSSSTGRDGRPQIYQASSSTHCAPGGIKESRKMERDSTTGVQKVSVSHQIGDKSRTYQKKVNLQTNETEENKEYINIDEDDEQSFSHEWDAKTRSYSRMLGGAGGHDHYANSRGLPAVPDSTHRRDRGSYVDHTHTSPPMNPRMQPYSMDDSRRKREKKAKVSFQ